MDSRVNDLDPSKNCVPVEMSQDLISTILETNETVNWSKTVEDYDLSCFHLVPLEESSVEFAQVCAKFAVKTYSFKPNTIERVENPFLLGQYLLKKSQNPNFREVHLFHATALANVNSICDNNFNWRKKGLSRGTKFGQGVSFASNAYYASHFTETRVMFLVKVLVGNSTRGCCLTTIPPAPYDTTDNGKGTVYVKYEDNDFYPEYVIKY